MHFHQSIQRPVGISVFGSSALRVEPDVAIVRFTIANTESKAPAAFAATRTRVEAVRKALDASSIGAADIQASHVLLQPDVRGYGKDAEFLGHRAQVSFSLRVTQLDRLENLLSSVLEAGATAIDETSFATTRLGELRVQTRREAFAAARRKAQVYAELAEATLGPVLHVEDVDPMAMSGGGHQTQPDLSGEIAGDHLWAPGSIEVTAAVLVAFAMDPVRKSPGFA